MLATWLAATLSTVVAALVLAIVAGTTRLALIVRDNARETRTLTLAVAKLTEDMAQDHDRLAAVEHQLDMPGRPRHRRDDPEERYRYGRN